MLGMPLSTTAQSDVEMVLRRIYPLEIVLTNYLVHIHKNLLYYAVKERLLVLGDCTIVACWHDFLLHK